MIVNAKVLSHSRVIDSIRNLTGHTFLYLRQLVYDALFEVLVYESV